MMGYWRRGLVLGLVLAMLLGGGWAVRSQWRTGARYPGAVQLSEQRLWHGWPALQMRRTTAYRSDDPFPQVYNWYGHRYDMGGEQQASGGCSHMFSSDTALIFSEQVSVTVCETVEGRLIFVGRLTAVAWRRWLP